MNIEYKEPELLKQIKQGDRAAAETWLSLLTNQTYRPEQVPAVLCAAAVGLGEVKGKDEKTEMVFGDLARLAAYKMYDLVPIFRNRLLAHFANPDAVSVKELSESIAAAEILLRHRLIKNGGVLDLCDAIAEGLYSTNDREKTRLLKGAGGLAIEAFPGGEGSDLGKAYISIFTLAERPSTNLESERVRSLKRRLEKLESGEPNFTRMAGGNRDRIALRMSWAMNLQPKQPVFDVKGANPNAPLSDGDTKLPNPMAGRKQNNGGLIGTLSSIGSKLAKRNAPPQKQGQ